MSASAVLAEPGNGRALGLLAMIDAGLGRREEAVDEARRAYDQSSKVAIDAPVRSLQSGGCLRLDGAIRSCSCCSRGW